MKKKLFEYFQNLIKYIPLLTCILVILYNIVELNNLHIHLLNFICGLSLLQIIFYYFASNLLLFCWKHKLCIHYLALVWSINLIDTYCKFPISNSTYHLFIIIIGIMFYIYYLIKNFTLNR